MSYQDTKEALSHPKCPTPVSKMLRVFVQSVRLKSSDTKYIATVVP